MNWELLLFFLVILAAVAASNIWLRRRAEKTNEAERNASGPSDQD